MDELSVMDPPRRDVAYQGGALRVSPLKVGKIPAFARAVRPMFAALAGVIASPPSGDGAGEGGELEIDMAGILGLIADHGEAMIEAAAVATGAKKETLEEGSPVEFAALIRAIVEVNADFFSQAVGSLGAQSRVAGST